MVRTVLVGAKCPAFCGTLLHIKGRLFAEFCGSVACYKKECALNMNLKPYVRPPKGELRDDNAARTQNGPLTKEDRQAYSATVLALAELMDAIARHEVSHVTLGTPRSGDAFLLTVNVVGQGARYVGLTGIMEFGERVLAEVFTT